MTPQLPTPAPIVNNKVFLRSVAALVVPIALQNLINVGVNSADVIMLGRVDEVVLGAASLAGQVPFVLLLSTSGWPRGPRCSLPSTGARATSAPSPWWRP